MCLILGKERLQLVLKVKNDGMIPARAVKELHRSRTWASDWLKRYQEEDVVGLKDRSKSGRPTEVPKEVLLASKQGWYSNSICKMSNMIEAVGDIPRELRQMLKKAKRFTIKVK